ncbi:MAG TPA: hypothetical protein VF236_03145 [Gaiellaceae bacterium]
MTVSRVLQHRRITLETVLGALCAYVLIGLLFAFVYLAVEELRSGPFFAQPGPHQQSEYLYFSFVASRRWGSATSRRRSGCRRRSLCWRRWPARSSSSRSSPGS